MKKIILSILMTLVCLNALTAKAAKFVVIGEDDREVAPTTYPYSAIGKVTTASGLLCTGFLVSKSIFVTNAHCVLNEKKEVLPVADVEFYLAAQKKSFVAKRIKVASKYNEDQMRYDFAFVEIDEEAGYHAGYFGTRPFDGSYERQNKFQLSGYATDFKLGFEQFRQTALCRVEQPSSEGLMMHTCDMETGSSGAPLFVKINEQFYVLGINSRQSAKGKCESFNKNDCFNLAVPFQQVGVELIDFQKKS